MTGSEFDIFLLGTIILCCVMAIFNLVKNAKRGWSGVLLGTGFLVLGGTAYLYRTGAPVKFVYAGCALLLILLTADFIVRAGKPPTRKKR